MKGRSKAQVETHSAFLRPTMGVNKHHLERNIADNKLQVTHKPWFA